MLWWLRQEEDDWVSRSEGWEDNTCWVQKQGNCEHRPAAASMQKSKKWDRKEATYLQSSWLIVFYNILFSHSLLCLFITLFGYHLWADNFTCAPNLNNLQHTLNTDSLTTWGHLRNMIMNLNVYAIVLMSQCWCLCFIVCLCLCFYCFVYIWSLLFVS